VKREARGEREHRAKVNANENTVINGAGRIDPDDQSAEANRIRETAADITARRAASN
jgi:hypothetical protein